MHRGFRILLFAAAAGSIGQIWLPHIPLGIPGEWTWDRIPLEKGGIAPLLLGFLLAGTGLLVYAAVVWLGAQRIDRCSRLEKTCWLGALVAAGFGWLSLVQESPAEGYGNAKSMHVLFYPGSSGYFYEARYGIDDVPSFLSSYEETVAEGEVLHAGTHPPGLVLLHRGLIALCRSSPGLTEFVLAARPDSVRSAGEMLRRQRRGTSAPLGQSDLAALWLAALLTQFVGVLAVVPLFLLIRRTHDRQASWLAAALWPLVPALAVFLPKSDALFPFIGLMFLYLWLEGCRRRSLLLCAAAGLWFWLGMFLSLAVLPVGLLALLLGLWETRATDRDWKLFGLSAAVGGAAFLSAVAAMWAGYDLNLLNVWRWNVVNHAGFYDQFTRTYWKWLLVNPLELALAAGLPLAILAVAGGFRTYRQWKVSPGSENLLRLGPVVCCAATIGLLWLSGKNSGEAARLWLFLMPWLIWLAAAMFETREDERVRRFSAGNGAVVVFLLQAIVCIATVTRVTGFHVAW